MKTCDICGGKRGFFHSFRCQDGVICKNCYRIVSGNYATTITGKTIQELKKIYIQNAQPLDLGADGFETTRKIGSLLLIDEGRRKFCVLNHPKKNGSAARPQIYSRSDVTAVRLQLRPAFSQDELEKLMDDKSKEQTADSLSVQISLKDGQVCRIPLLTSPVRLSTYAFRQSYQLARQMVEALNTL